MKERALGGQEGPDARFAVRLHAGAAQVSQSGPTNQLFWLLVVHVITVFDHVQPDIIFISATYSRLPPLPFHLP